MACIAERTTTSTAGASVVIRTARPDDAAAMLAYIRPVAAETEFFVLKPDEFPATEEKEREWIRDHLDSPGKILLLAEVGGTIVGNVSFENGSYRRIAHRGTFGVAVVKQWRGQGVGTALLRTLLEWAEANPLIDKADLEVFATNQRAMRLYRRLGFVEEGRRPKEVKLGPGRFVDTILMHKFVKSEHAP